MDLERRLEFAQMLNQLLKQGAVIRFKSPKVNKEIAEELDTFVKRQLNNLLLKVMGECTEEVFSNEEAQILKTLAGKIRMQATRSDA